MKYLLYLLIIAAVIYCLRWRAVQRKADAERLAEKKHAIPVGSSEEENKRVHKS